MSNTVLLLIGDTLIPFEGYLETREDGLVVFRPDRPLKSNGFLTE